MTTRPKVTIVGAGSVGATTAHWLLTRDVADIVLFDVVDGVPQGKALDLQESAPVFGYSVKVVGTNDWASTAGSDVVVITAGSARKPGMSRDDLLKVNDGVVGSVAKAAAEKSPDAVILVVTNPVDVMTYVAQKASGFPHQRVFGQAGVLDSARFRAFLAMELGISPKDVFAFVLGGHGDQMVPLVRYSTAGGRPIADLLPKDRLDAIVERTRKGGGEIVELLKTGSAYYAPAASVAEMVEAVLLDQKRILPSVAYLDGAYGERDVYVGVPTRLGKGGVEEVIEIELLPDEREAFRRSVAAVRGPLGVLGY